MDADRFDTLSRSLSTRGSRRRTLTTALGAAIGLHRLFTREAVDAHNAVPACKKKSGKAKKKCLKKARAHNARHAVVPPSEDRTPVDPCAGVSCGAVPHGMSACQNGACVVSSCEGDNYDVDGDVANGCEAADDGRDNHTTDSATLISGGQTCVAARPRSVVTGKIVSDERPHDPEPIEFDAATGATPDFWFLVWDCLQIQVDLTLTGGACDAECYRFRVFTPEGTVLMDDPGICGSGGAPRTILDTGGSTVFFSLEKTCSSAIHEAVSYTLTVEGVRLF